MQVRKDLTQDKTILDEWEISDEDQDNITECTTYKDEIPRQKVTTERVTVSRKDLRAFEETEKPKYPKDFNIGRIVIEEIPEKEDILERDISEKKKVRGTRTDRTVSHRDVKQQPKTSGKEETVKVGKFDTTDRDRVIDESRQVKERMQTVTTREGIKVCRFFVSSCSCQINKTRVKDSAIKELRVNVQCSEP